MPDIISVNISTESQVSNTSGGVVFIYESDTAPRNLIIESVSDAQHTTALADFCTVVFSQKNSLNYVHAIAKRKSETYAEAYFEEKPVEIFVAIDQRKKMPQFAPMLVGLPCIVFYSDSVQTCPPQENLVYIYQKEYTISGEGDVNPIGDACSLNHPQLLLPESNVGTMGASQIHISFVAGAPIEAIEPYVFNVPVGESWRDTLSTEINLAGDVLTLYFAITNGLVSLTIKQIPLGFLFSTHFSGTHAENFLPLTFNMSLIPVDGGSPSLQYEPLPPIIGTPTDTSIDFSMCAYKQVSCTPTPSVYSRDIVLSDFPNGFADKYIYVGEALFVTSDLVSLGFDGTTVDSFIDSLILAANNVAYIIERNPLSPTSIRYAPFILGGQQSEAFSFQTVNRTNYPEVDSIFIDTLFDSEPVVVNCYQGEIPE